MSEKPEDEFDDDADLIGADSDNARYDYFMEDLSRPKRGSAPVGEPAWRKLEKYREKKLTAEQVSDFDDYDIDDIEPSKVKIRRKQHPE